MENLKKGDPLPFDGICGTRPVIQKLYEGYVMGNQCKEYAIKGINPVPEKSLDPVLTGILILIALGAGYEIGRANR